MCSKKSAQTLRTLCMRNIVKNFTELETEMANLPCNVINDFFHEAVQLKMDVKNLSSPLFINPETTKLIFNNFKVDRFDELIDRICQMCKKITYLDVNSPEGPEVIDTRTQIRLIQTFTQLQYLDLNDYCTDHVLSIISTNCPQLRHLDLSDCNQITDNGIHTLFPNENMKIVYLNLTDTQITAQCCFHILNNSPFLKYFHHKHWNHLLNILKQQLNSNSGVGNNRTYSLELFQPFECNLNKDNHLVIAATLFPQVRAIDTITSFVDLNILLSLKNFQKLTKLTIYDVYVDVRLIGLNCPLLETVNLKFMSDRSVPMAANHVTDDVNFQKLFTHLRHLRIECEFDSVLEEELNSLLRNCYQLETLFVHSCQALSDDFISSIVTFNPLRCLSDLKIYLSHSISVRSLTMFLAMDIPLNIVSIKLCSLINEDDKLQLLNRIHRENLNVTVNFF